MNFVNESSQLQPPTIDTKPAKKTRGKQKIKIEFIEQKQRRQITFYKRKAGLIKKAHELQCLTGTNILLLMASETGHVYTYATPELQPMITNPENQALIKSCLGQKMDHQTQFTHISAQDAQEAVIDSPPLSKSDASPYPQMTRMEESFYPIMPMESSSRDRVDPFHYHPTDYEKTPMMNLPPFRTLLTRQDYQNDPQFDFLKNRDPSQ
jgi:hypothetical protein